MNFMKFEPKYFDRLDNTTFEIVRDYFYLHEFWIDHNFGLDKTYKTAILKAITAN